MKDIDDVATDVDLVLEGMSCPRCVTRVEETLATLPGVASARVSMGQARVRYCPQIIHLATIYARLARLGYRVLGPPLKGLAKLVARITADRNLGRGAIECCALHPDNRRPRPA